MVETVHENPWQIWVTTPPEVQIAAASTTKEKMLETQNPAHCKTSNREPGKQKYRPAAEVEGGDYWCRDPSGCHQSPPQQSPGAQTRLMVRGAARFREKGEAGQGP